MPRMNLDHRGRFHPLLRTYLLLSGLSLLSLVCAWGQPLHQSTWRAQLDSLPPRPATFHWVVPTVLMPVGIALTPDYPASHLDRFYVRSFIQQQVHRYTPIDDYLLYGPMAGWAGLSLSGVQGRTQPLDRAGIALLAHGLTTVLVLGLKQATHEQRPDGSDFYSFSSGHTALAFTGAGLLDREFGNLSPLISVGGYAMATTTGVLRMTNNKHWVSDVLVGAGIGLLSAEAAYHLYPWAKRILTRRHHPRSATR